MKPGKIFLFGVASGLAVVAFIARMLHIDRNRRSNRNVHRDGKRFLNDLSAVMKNNDQRLKKLEDAMTRITTEVEPSQQKTSQN